MSAVAAPLPVRLARLVRLEHTVFALPFAYVGALLAVDGWPGLAADGVDHGRDGRRANARDGPQPARRRRDRRPQPSDGGAGAPGRRAHAARRSSRSAASRSRVYLVAVLAARSDRPLAVADPGGHVRRLPVPQARHVALPPLARRVASASRPSARGSASRASCRGRRGRSAAPSASGSPASTSSTRSSIASTTSPRGCTRGRRGSACAVCSAARVRCMPARLLLLAQRARASTSGVWYWLGVAVVGGAPRLRARDRPAGRPAAPRRRLLHRQRRALDRVRGVRRARHASLASVHAAGADVAAVRVSV